MYRSWTATTLATRFPPRRRPSSRRKVPVIHYRRFRNTDPPGLMEVWNDAFTQRGAVRMQTSSPLERHAFAKLYFDPAGLIIAEESGVCVGFAHAGFGSDAKGEGLLPDAGVTCLLGVRA